MVTPENPLRAKAIRAPSRIAWRVRSDLRSFAPGAEALGAMGDRQLRRVIGLRVEPSGPCTKALEARRLRSRKSRRIHVALVIPDLDILWQCLLGHSEALREIARLVIDPISGEDIRRGVVNRGGTDRDHPNSFAGMFAVEAHSETAPVDFDGVQGVPGTIDTVEPAPPETDFRRPRRVVGILPQHCGADRRAVNKPEMVRVNGILGNSLGMHGHSLEPCPAVRAERVVAAGRDMLPEHLEAIGHLPQRFPTRGVVPDINSFVAFGDRIGTDPPTFVRPILVGDTDVASFPVPHPPVERALNTVVDDASPVGEVRAEMPAVCIEDTNLAVVTPERDQVAAEIMQRRDLPNPDISAPSDLKPSRRLHARQRRHPITLLAPIARRLP